MLDARGQWVRGWEVEGKDGQRYPCGVLCDRQALEYARQRIPEELKTHPYRCRFIDTTTASPWRECYDPDHPMTRSESRHWKMELLEYVSEDCRPGHRQRDRARGGRALRALLRGHAQPGAIPRARRRPGHAADLGRGARAAWRSSRPATSTGCRSGNWSTTTAWWPSGTGATTTTSCRSFGTGATCSTPSTARRRCSCSTANCGRSEQERFVRSYRTAAPVARATGYAEMLSHRWLTADHAVQQTRFAGGVTVTVNFGDRPYKLADGEELPPLGHRVEGVKTER